MIDGDKTIFKKTKEILVVFKHDRYCFKIEVFKQILREKTLVWHIHVFLSPCVATEKNSIISPAFLPTIYNGMICSWMNLSLTFPNSFVCLCKQFMNVFHILFCLLHVFDHVKNVCSFHPIECILNTLKYKNFCPKAVKFLNSFVNHCIQTFNLIFIKASSSAYIWYANRIPNLEFLHLIGFGVKLIREHEHKPTVKNVIFWLRWPHKEQIHQTFHFENLSQEKKTYIS